MSHNRFCSESFLRQATALWSKTVSSSSSTGLAVGAASLGFYGGFIIQQGQWNSNLSGSIINRRSGGGGRIFSSWGPATCITKCEEQQPTNNKVFKANLQKRMTVIGHFSMLSETKWNPSVITIALGLKGTKPFHVEDFIRQWKDQKMSQKHPRFHWKVTSSGYFDTSEASNFELPVTEGLPPVQGTERKDILSRIVSLQLGGLDLSHSLWRAHIIPSMRSPFDSVPTSEKDEKSVVSSNIVPSPTRKQKSQDNVHHSILLLQSHHALADGVSMSASFLDLADEAEELRQMVKDELAKRRAKVKSFWQKFRRQILLLCWFIFGSFWACLHQLRLFWLSWVVDTNPWNKLRRLTRSTEPTRTVSATPVCTVQDAKRVAMALSGDGTKGSSKKTINDVLVTAITAALARQLQVHRERLSAKEQPFAPEPSAKRARTTLRTQKHMNVVVPVHLKGGVLLPGESVGNHIGAFCARVPAEGNLSPDQRLAQVHASLMAVKQTPAPFLSFAIANLVTRFLPASWASLALRNANAGATCVVTNVRGAPMPLHFQGHTVESAYGFLPIPPGIPIGIAILSYNGKIFMSVTAESWAIPDGDQFMAWVLEEYIALAKVAARTAK